MITNPTYANAAELAEEMFITMTNEERFYRDEYQPAITQEDLKLADFENIASNLAYSYLCLYLPADSAFFVYQHIVTWEVIQNLVERIQDDAEGY